MGSIITGIIENTGNPPGITDLKKREPGIVYECAYALPGETSGTGC
jgi:hypothetical protein